CSLADAPSVVMPNGTVMFAASVGAFNSPTSFFFYDPTGNSFSSAPATSDAASISNFYVNFLILPTGQIMAFETYTSNVQIYTPSGSPNSAWMPTVNYVPTCLVANSSYSLTGTQLAGLTEGAMYGDDVQMSTNYPIVKIVNNSSGNVYYARTYNWSTNSIAT